MLSRVVILLFLLVGLSAEAIVFKGAIGYRYNVVSSKSDSMTDDVGYQFGLRYHYLLRPELSIKTGISYSQVFFSWDKSGKLVSGGINYLDIPITVAYWLNERSSVFIGPQAGMSLGKSCPQEDKDCSFSNPVKYRVSALGGYEFKFNKNVMAEIYLEYNLGALSDDISSTGAFGGNLLFKF